MWIYIIDLTKHISPDRLVMHKHELISQYYGFDVFM